MECAAQKIFESTRIETASLRTVSLEKRRSEGACPVPKEREKTFE